MRRITDVLDVWFDSGSMPFAQVHYPFENRDWFDSHNPADFIVEYIGQTRGWFYTLHTLSTALFDRPAFSNVVSHGIVLGSDGQKMSKSLRNYPDVNEVFDRDGADAMRWFLMSSSVIRGGNLVVTEQGIREGVRQFLLPLWNTWYFFSLYANAAGYTATRRTDSTDVLDRYLLAKTNRLLSDLTAHLDALDSPLAAADLRDFADVLTNWYVRRSRARFWAGDPDAFDTLFSVLETVTRAAAPLIPLVAEEIWQGLTGGRSVHLADWPDAAEFPLDDALVGTMDLVRDIASSGLALRKATGNRVRLPLPELTVVAESAHALERFGDILKDELNVKALTLRELGDGVDDFGITRRLTVNARALGPRLGRDVQKVISAAKSGAWESTADGVTVGGFPLNEGEYELELQARDESQAITFLPGGGFVLLDTETTEALEAEGLARDVVRAVQDARKSAGLQVSDRISLRLAFGSESERAAVASFESMIADEVLATSISTSAAEPIELETLAALQGEVGAYRAVVPSGRYANTQSIVIELSARGGTVDV